MKFLITGGAGFIGSAVIRYLIENTSYKVLNLDKLTYAGNLESLDLIKNSNRYSFVQADICDGDTVYRTISEFRPDIVMHLAAESHVDRSIDEPDDFIQTNIVGTYRLLEAVLKYWQQLNPKSQEKFRFHHVSTDEVYGDLGGTDDLFHETTAYAPSSPYSASKASSDHLVCAWHKTFGLPTIVTNCSNNYGPFQFPEKLIPHMILNAISGNDLPIYGGGDQIRDWLHVEDHARALVMVALESGIGETYNIGGNNEVRNVDTVHLICRFLEELAPQKPGGIGLYSDLVTFVEDRPGHDLRYAVDTGKIKKDFGWVPNETFESGLYRTIQWYLNHQVWWRRVLDGGYRLDRMGEKSI